MECARRHHRVIALVAALACAAGVPAAMARSRGDLLRATQNCVAAAKQHRSLPSGCKYSSPRGYVVFEEHNQEYLFVPTAIITGIEDPKILAPKALPYWRYAWGQAKRYFHGRSPWQIGLAINSKTGRSQDQLHIHMTCMKKTVGDALHRAHISSTAWSKISLAGHTYYARHVKSLKGGHDPFRMVYSKIGSKRSVMEQETIVVTGAKSGYYILNDFTHSTNRAHGEELLDSHCGKKK
jgi:CDP-diacylglycerol pyrophosphatase